MEEIYWLTRLDSINTFVFVSIVVSVCVFLGTGLFCLIESSDSCCDEESVKKVLKYTKGSCVAFFLLMLVKIFIPTTQDALMIYGVGGIIDYVKSNKTVKQLPDKCIEALDKWVDSLNEEEKKEK